MSFVVNFVCVLLFKTCMKTSIYWRCSSSCFDKNLGQGYYCHWKLVTLKSSSPKFAITNDHSNLILISVCRSHDSWSMLHVTGRRPAQKVLTTTKSFRPRSNHKNSEKENVPPNKQDKLARIRHESKCAIFDCDSVVFENETVPSSFDNTVLCISDANSCKMTWKEVGYSWSVFHLWMLAKHY